MTSSATLLIEELSGLSTLADFSSDVGAQANALRLSKKLITALQKPEDAALELAIWVF
jgi:hypothetical protein